MPVMMLQLVWSVERSDRKTFSILPGFHGQVWLGNHGQICSLIQSMDFQGFPIAEWIFFRIEKEHMESPGWQLIIWYFLILQSFPGLNQSAKFHAGFFSVLRTSLMLAVRFSTLVAWAPMCCCSNHHFCLYILGSNSHVYWFNHDFWWIHMDSLVYRINLQVLQNQPPFVVGLILSGHQNQQVTDWTSP